MNTTENNIATADPIKKRNRLFGLLILGIILVPMCIAYIMFKTGWGVSPTTTNNGQLLIPPQAIQSLVLDENTLQLASLFAQQGIRKVDNKAASEKDAATDSSSHKKYTGKKWRLLVPVTASCSTACENNLYISRQVHVRLAEKAYRVERIIVALEALPETLEQRLTQEHPNTVRTSTTLTAFNQWLSPSNAPALVAEHYYLVDQDGYVMMAYHAQHTGQELLSDIKRLLKYTYDK